MNIVMISPGYPAEMAFFARGLADAGAAGSGIGDQPPSSVPQAAREALAHYLQVGSLAAGDAVVATVDELAQHMRIDRVECLWEPYMLLAARLREELGLPGMSITQTFPFRDKELMKQVLGAAGLGPPGTRRRGPRARRGARRGPPRFPAHRKADRRRRSRRPLPGRPASRPRRDPADAPAPATGHRRGVHRRGGVHLRHHLR